MFPDGEALARARKGGGRSKGRRGSSLNQLRCRSAEEKTGTGEPHIPGLGAETPFPWVAVIKSDPGETARGLLLGAHQAGYIYLNHLIRNNWLPCCLYSPTRTPSLPWLSNHDFLRTFPCYASSLPSMGLYFTFGF